MTQPSQRLLELIASFEAFKSEAYICPGGAWTIGYGTTHYPGTKEPVKRGDKCTREQAWSWLSEDTGVIRDDVIGAIAWEAPEHIVDACTCFAYNVGLPGFVSSTALKRLNAGDRPGAATALKWWNKATDPKTGKKRVLGGLVARREAEADLLVNGWDGTAGGTPVNVAENRPTLSRSKTIIGIALAGGTWIATTLAPMLPQLLPQVWGQSIGVRDQLMTAPTVNDFMLQSVGILGGLLLAFWARRKDIKTGSPFGSQGR
ncbi:MAG: lysozyme [Reyranellaceae bacterium]